MKIISFEKKKKHEKTPKSCEVDAGGGRRKKDVLIDAVGTCAYQSWWWERLRKTWIGNRFVCVFSRQPNA